MRFPWPLKQRQRSGQPSHLAFGDVSAVGLPPFDPYSLHVLPHGTDIIVLLLIIIEALRLKWVWLVSRSLLFVEPVVLYKGLNAVIVHKTVVLL